VLDPRGPPRDCGDHSAWNPVRSAPYNLPACAGIAACRWFRAVRAVTRPARAVETTAGRALVLDDSTTAGQRSPLLQTLGRLWPRPFAHEDRSIAAVGAHSGHCAPRRRAVRAEKSPCASPGFPFSHCSANAALFGSRCVVWKLISSRDGRAQEYVTPTGHRAGCCDG